MLFQSWQTKSIKVYYFVKEWLEVLSPLLAAVFIK